jgi:uncharacterized protein YjbJ (UPF0337 family)
VTEGAAGWLGTFRGYRSGLLSRILVLTGGPHVRPIGAAVMNKDRIAGAAKEAKGSVKEVVGKAVGDSKLESEGKADKVEGKIQNAIGGLKDALKG